MNLSQIRHTFQTYGTAAGTHDLVKKAVNRVVPLRILRTIRLTLEGVDRAFLEMPAGYVGHFATTGELRRWREDARYDLDDAFLEQSAARGDRCYAITHQGELVSYGWYSRRPTLMNDRLAFHFDPAWVYMFKGLTLPEFRGQRLHAIGMAHALQAYVQEGSKGILSYVESNNFASLRSCYRMGYEDVGTIVVLEVRGRTLTLRTPACRGYGLDVRSAVSEDDARDFWLRRSRVDAAH